MESALTPPQSYLRNHFGLECYPVPREMELQDGHMGWEYIGILAINLFLFYQTKMHVISVHLFVLQASMWFN